MKGLFFDYWSTDDFQVIDIICMNLLVETTSETQGAECTLSFFLTVKTIEK